MVDVVDKATRSRMMSGIRGSNTLPERTVRSFLHAKGFRFRLHSKKLPGRPDLVLKKHGSVVFVHGCFWHRHPGCRFATTPATNKTFWRAKFEANTARDRRNTNALRRLGWRVFVVWECKSDQRALAKLAERLAATRPIEPARRVRPQRTQGSRTER